LSPCFCLTGGSGEVSSVSSSQVKRAAASGPAFRRWFREMHALAELRRCVSAPGILGAQSFVLA
jgi:hypothetical protein